MPLMPRQIRSRTRSGRLIALDAYLLGHEGALLARADDSVVVDVGFGEHPWTTLEMAEAFRALHPELVVVGLETDPRRVEEARHHGDEKTLFVAVQPELASILPGPARLVRAMNVLRGYGAAEVAEAHATWGAPLCDGGLLVEGTSDPDGAILTAHLMRKRGGALEREGLLLYTNFGRGFAPWMFRDWLPRDLRRGVYPGTELHDFFTAWTDAWNAVRLEGTADPAQAFVESARRLARQRPDVGGDDERFAAGYLLIRSPTPGAPATPESR